MSLLNDAIRQPKSMAAGFKIVYVGKEIYPLIILGMAPVKSDRWKKSASFESISTTIRAQANVRNTVDLISVISQEVPIDVTTVFMESTRAKKRIISNMPAAGYLSGVAFLHSDGRKTKNLFSSEKKTRF